jgi:uncharacterized damage-inducible protein DinB
VELHEIELNRFYDTWQKFLASGTPLPETADLSYQSADHLGGHVFRAARGHLTWIGECAKRLVAGLDTDTDCVSIARKGRPFVDAVLEAWRRELALLEDPDLAPATYKSRWGQDDNTEQMLEHVVVHPMRHRIQLERLMAEGTRSPEDGLRRRA